MSQLKLEILLPLFHNPDENGHRKPINGDEFTTTYQELIERFGGCTNVPTPISGSWINPSTSKQITDELTIYWIIYEDTESNVRFIKNYKEILKKRFQQDDIMMYSISVTQF